MRRDAVRAPVRPTEACASESSSTVSRIPSLDAGPYSVCRLAVMEPLVPKRRLSPSAVSPTASASPPRARPVAAAMDHILEKLLALPDPSVSLEVSLERLLDSRLLEVEKDQLVDGAMEAGSALLEAARRSARRRASNHNCSSWPLASDLTIKVNRIPFRFSLSTFLSWRCNKPLASYMVISSGSSKITY